MRPEDVPKYQAEVRALAEKYKDKIEILCGVEQDACSTAPTEDFDYVIGSVHYVEKNGMYYCVDEGLRCWSRAFARASAVMYMR